MEVQNNVDIEGTKHRETMAELENNFHDGIKRLANNADGQRVTVEDGNGKSYEIDTKTLTPKFLQNISIRFISGIYKGVSFTFHRPLRNNVPPRLLIASKDNTLKKEFDKFLTDIIYIYTPQIDDLTTAPKYEKTNDEPTADTFKLAKIPVISKEEEMKRFPEL